VILISEGARSSDAAARKMMWRYLRQISKLALMDDSQKRKSRLELGHVLFIHVTGYSKLTTKEESEALPELNRIVRNTDQRTRQTAGPNGIGGFTRNSSPESIRGCFVVSQLAAYGRL